MNPLEIWHQGDPPWCGFVLISPSLAEEWLRLNFRNYRRISDQVAVAYARSMDTESWQTTHQAICLCWDEDNARVVLGDGQHRLTAIVKSGRPQIFLVVVGLPISSMRDVDTQRRRSAAVALNIAGVTITPRQIQIIRAAAAGISGKSSLSNAEIHRFFETYRNAVIFSDRLFTTRLRLYGQAVIGGAVVLAYYHRSSYSKDMESHRQRLAEFADVLRTGASPRGMEDSAAAYFRAWLAANPKSHLGTGGRTELVRKLQPALAAFLGRREVKRLLPSTDKDLFPLPREPEYEEPLEELETA